MHSNTDHGQDARDADLSVSVPKLQRLVLGLLIFCFLCAFFHVSDVDVGYHIRTGEHIMAGHGVPAQNTFSHTVPNEPWLAQQWMPATIYSWIHRVGGVAALTTFKALLATALMSLIWLSAQNAAGKNSLWPLWLATVAVLILRVRFYERPDLFTSTLFALTVLLDQRFGTNRRWQWIFLPLLMALWANTHAGYVYGFVLLSAWAGAEWLEFFFTRLRVNTSATRPLQSLLVRPVGIALSVISAVVSIQLVNPNGWKVLTVPFTQFLSKFWQSVIVEYFPPTWTHSKLLYIWAAALVVLQIITWRQTRLRYLLTTATFGYFAFSSQRSLSAFIIVSVPHAAHMLANLLRPNFTFMARLARLPRILLPVSWAALVALVIVPDRTYEFGVGLYHPYYPTEIFQFVEREVTPQKLFNDMRFGGPMLWKLYPRFKPYIDGRGDAYSEEFWKTEYLPAVQGEDKWQELFQKYEVTGALLSIETPTKVSRLAKRLFEHPDWALVAYNDETLLFLKRTEANRPLIQSHSFAHLWPGNWNFGDINTTNLATMAPEAARAWDLYPGLYAHAVAARCAMASGDFASASEMFRFLVKQSDASEGFWKDYAYCLYTSKQHAQAERVLADMIHKGLAVGFAYYLKHFIALENRQPEEAKALLAKALASEPDNTAYRQAWLRFQASPTADSGRRS
jgi:hypothetical protein